MVKVGFRATDLDQRIGHSGLCGGIYAGKVGTIKSDLAQN